MERTIIPSGKWLYRYDLSQPLNEWSMDFHNPEYMFDFGNKNQFGGFFFFDSESQAENTGRKSLERYRNQEFEGLWITKCQVTSNSEFLDLRGYMAITAILYDFHQNGIDLFNDKFHEYYSGSKKPFVDLKQPIELLCDIISNPDWYKDREASNDVESVIKFIETYFIDNDTPGILGQCLTDFENGTAFKAVLEENNFEGYVFNEANGLTGTDTFCFLSSDKLSHPQNRMVKL